MMSKLDWNFSSPFAKINASGHQIEALTDKKNDRFKGNYTH